MADPATNALRANLQNAAIALVLVHAVGTLGYYLIAEGKATVFDAFYMTFITVATIGYAEVIDLSHGWGGRVFTVAIGLVGIGYVWVMFSPLLNFEWVFCGADRVKGGPRGMRPGAAHP
jgi:hypothetical protein